jgi:hypothetical protein
MVTTTRTRTPGHVQQAICAAIGVVLLVVGVAGLVQGGLDGMTSTPATVSESTVGGLGGSPLLNLWHLVVGVLALLCSLRLRTTAIVGIVGSIAFLALTAYDIVTLIAGQDGEPLNVRWPALCLHIAVWAAASTIVVLYFRTAREGDPEPT